MQAKFFLVFIIGAGIFFLYNVVLYFRTKVPIVISPKVYVDKLLKYLKQEYLVDNKTVVYELGSGWGDFSFAIEKLGPKKIIAYELSPVHILFSKLKAKFIHSKVVFEKKDFFEADLSEADLVYVYLVPEIVDKLWQKMKKECKSGTMMILLGHPMGGLEPIKKISVNSKKTNSGIYYFYKI